MELKQMSLTDSSDLDLKSYIEELKSKPLTSQQDELEKLIDTLKQSSKKYSSSDVLTVLGFLIGSGITKVNFGDIMGLYPEEPEFKSKVLGLISSEAISIKEFSIDGNPVSKIEDAFWLEIGMMGSLNTVRISGYHFILEDLMEMSAGLRRLVTLDVKIHPKSYIPTNDTAFLKKFRKSFGHLKSFLFSSLWMKSDFGEMFQQKLTQFSIEHLRNLQNVGEQIYFVDMTSLCKENNKPSQLRQLILNMDTFEQEECSFGKFPEVNCLILLYSDSFIYRPVEETKLHLMRNLSKINTLKFDNLESTDYLKFFLETYGKNLLKLTHANTSHSKMKLDLKSVQGLCPKLKSMHVGHTLILLEGCAMKNFTKLKTITVEFSLDSSYIWLSEFLAPPALESIKLVHLKVTRKELLNTVSRTNKKEILKQVLVLILQVYVAGGEMMKRAIQETGNELVKEFLNMKPWMIAKFNVEE